MPSSLSPHELEAYELGKDAAEAAATWAADGNMDVDERKRVLQMIRDGDPAAFDYLPRYPDLSGEWADDPTPTSLAVSIYGEPIPGDEHEWAAIVDAIADAWETGVSDHFELACERELIKFTEGGEDD